MLLPFQGATAPTRDIPRVSLRLPWAPCSIGPSARTCTHASTTISNEAVHWF